MDGVIRSGAGALVQPAAAAALAVPMPMAPLRPAGPRMDGLMRLVPAPAAVSAPAPSEALPPSVPRWRLSRPVVVFSLLVPAMAIAAGAFVTQHHEAAPADTAVAASQPAAAAASAAASAPASAPAAGVAQQSAQLQSLLNGFVAGGSGEQYGIVVTDLTTGATASSGADTVMNSASLYKLFVAQRILAGVDTGQYTMGQPAGDQFGRNIDQCLRLMITISDNNCGVALGNIIGWEKQNSDLAALGFTHTNLKTLQQTSASDVAQYFVRLYKGTLLSPSSTAYLMNLLKSQQVNNRLPQGLPAGTVMAHKTGDLWDVVHDAGIVYGPKGPYLVVMMSGKWANVGNAPGRFASLSQQLYQLQSQ